MENCPISDRIALQDLVTAYASAVDSMHDLDGICAIFTQDAIFDLSGINFPSLRGHTEIRKFYAETFENMIATAHYLSNFAVTAFNGDTASVRTYVTGMGRLRSGENILVHGRYYFDFSRIEGGWKAHRYWMDFLLPPE